MTAVKNPGVNMGNVPESLTPLRIANPRFLAELLTSDPALYSQLQLCFRIDPILKEKLLKPESGQDLATAPSGSPPSFISVQDAFIIHCQRQAYNAPSVHGRFQMLIGTPQQSELLSLSVSKSVFNMGDQGITIPKFSGNIEKIMKSLSATKWKSLTTDQQKMLLRAAIPLEAGNKNQLLDADSIQLSFSAGRAGANKKNKEPGSTTGIPSQSEQKKLHVPKLHGDTTLSVVESDSVKELEDLTLKLAKHLSFLRAAESKNAPASSVTNPTRHAPIKTLEDIQRSPEGLTSEKKSAPVHAAPGAQRNVYAMSPQANNTQGTPSDKAPVATTSSQGQSRKLPSMKSSRESCGEPYQMSWYGRGSFPPLHPDVPASLTPVMADPMSYTQTYDPMAPDQANKPLPSAFVDPGQVRPATHDFMLPYGVVRPVNATFRSVDPIKTGPRSEIQGVAVAGGPDGYGPVNGSGPIGATSNDGRQFVNGVAGYEYTGPNANHARSHQTVYKFPSYDAPLFSGPNGYCANHKPPF